MMKSNYIKREKIEIGAERSGPASFLIIETFFILMCLIVTKRYNIRGSLSC